MKNLKTTIAGYLVGLPVILMDLMEAYQAGTLDGKHGIGLIVAIGIIIFGHVAKDHNTTGGTVQQ